MSRGFSSFQNVPSPKKPKNTFNHKNRFFCRYLPQCVEVTKLVFGRSSSSPISFFLWFGLLSFVHFYLRCWIKKLLVGIVRGRLKIVLKIQNFLYLYHLKHFCSLIFNIIQQFHAERNYFMTFSPQSLALCRIKLIKSYDWVLWMLLKFSVCICAILFSSEVTIDT